MMATLPGWLAALSGASKFANNPANGYQATLGDLAQSAGHSMMQHYRGQGGTFGAGPGSQPLPPAVTPSMAEILPALGPQATPIEGQPLPPVGGAPAPNLPQAAPPLQAAAGPAWGQDALGLALRMRMLGGLGPQ